MASHGRSQRRRGWLLALAAAVVCASPLAAQAPSDPDAEATMRFGPLSAKSTLAVSNIGVDTNVFNATTADRPQSDFTMTFSPLTNLWFRMGRTWIDSTIKVDWVYYKRFASERGANSTYTIGVSRTLNRFRLRGAASHMSTRERPGFEIDVRSQRTERGVEGSFEFRARPKTFVGMRAQRRDVEFDQTATFLETNLSEELNRRVSANAFTIRHELTPLTALSLEITRDHERYDVSSLRDSDSTRVMGRISFQPLALINGSASVGYRRLTPLQGEIPAFRGTIATVGLSYALFGTTRLAINVTRDIQPSFQIDQPYYLETGITGTIQRQVYRSFDILARLGATRLAYRNRIGAVVQAPDRTDRVRTFGIGIGYRLGADKRIGFTVDRPTRHSEVERVQYSGLRYGMSVTYER